MAVFLKMPRLSDTMAEGVLVRWLKKEGDLVEPGEVVAEVETDKATMELESFDGGYVRRILVKEGEGVPVGTSLAILSEEEDEDIAAFLAGGGESDIGVPSKAVSSANGEAIEKEVKGDVLPLSSPPGGHLEKDGGLSDGEGNVGERRMKASPLARRMARENAVDLEKVQGSGPIGRIIKRDIERILAQRVESSVQVAPVSDFAALGQVERLIPEGAEILPLSGMRKTIARRMTEAKQSVPHFYLTSEVDMAAAMALRTELNAAAGEEVKISVNDLVLKACALALRDHPMVNASFDGDRIVLHPSVHMGIAVALEEGLITPTIRHAEQKSIGQLAREGRDLARKAQARKLKPEEYTGATFTVSNLGMLGIVEFVAIINPPQAAILAVGALRQVPVVVEGALKVGTRMRLTLSCDHRVIDGAVGARFLATLKEILETPLRLLI